MNKFLLETNQSGHFRLQGSMTIQNSTTITRELLEAVKAHDELSIDLSEVSRIDCTGVQLLLSTKLCANKILKLIHHSECVSDAIELINLGQHLNDPMLIPSSKA